VFLQKLMVRKPRVSLSLTPAAVAVLDELTTATELSRSALVEQMLQGKMAFESAALAWTVSIQDTEAGPTVATISSGPPTSSAPTAPTPAQTGPEATIDEADEIPVPDAVGTDASRDDSSPLPSLSGPDTEPVAQQQPEDDLATEITALQQQLADLKAQLAAAQTPAPVISTAVETPAPAVPSAGGPSASERINDPVPALQQQLVAAIAAQDDLQAQLQGQAQELATLRQQLAQQQSLAAVGEHQLNRWRYHTYAQ
jgi:ribosomal protein L29